MSVSPSLQTQIMIFAEAEPDLAFTIKRELELKEFWVHCCHTLDDASEWIFQHRDQPPDVIIIDTPGERSTYSMNAFKLYGLIRNGGWVPTEQQRFEGWEDNVPILMLIDAEKRLEVEERMYALGVQPDRIDYKPYQMNILTAKLNGLLQRNNGGNSAAADDGDGIDNNATGSDVDAVIRIRSLTINPAAETVTVDATPIKLSQLEFQLLYYLASHPDRPLLRETLLEDIWGITGKKAHNNRNVDVYMGRLRKKLAGTECADMVGRGHNGTYVLNTNTFADTFTEPEGTRPSATRASALHDALTQPVYLVRESNEPHLPLEFALHNVRTGTAHHVGIKFGRNGNTADCILIDKRVSRWHATIFIEQGEFFIRDENSTGHTYITREDESGQLQRGCLNPREHVRLAHGDLIYFNTVCYRFELR